MRDIRCPFCGAPYKRQVLQDALQLKCDYCGAVFRIPPRLGVDVPQCVNHPDRFAVGVCDDCDQSFCRECLQLYDFKSRGGSATLHLCPGCLCRREVKKANSYVFAGAFAVLMGVAAMSVVPAFGVFILIIGLVEVLYGFSSRASAGGGRSGDVGGSEVAAGEEATFAVPRELGEADVMYDELLSVYSSRFGLPGGPRVLDDEIRAYTFAGDSFEQAVAKVYRSQGKRH